MSFKVPEIASKAIFDAESYVRLLNSIHLKQSF